MQDQKNQNNINQSEIKESQNSRRSIRSFVIRSGRVTEKRKELINSNALGFLQEFDENKTLNSQTVFGNSNELTIEIGFGMGDSPLYFAKKFPDKNLIGIEVHLPGVARLYSLLEKNEIKNVRIINYDAVEVLNKMVADNSINSFQIFFPDPWPKKKHHKRRLLSTSFVALLASKLVRGGKLYIATDWADYALQIKEIINSNCDLELLVATADGYSTRCESRPITAFENKGIKKEHKIFDFCVVKK